MIPLYLLTKLHNDVFSVTAVMMGISVQIFSTIIISTFYANFCLFSICIVEVTCSLGRTTFFGVEEHEASNIQNETIHMGMKYYRMLSYSPLLDVCSSSRDQDSGLSMVQVVQPQQ